jgi:hypothetical protein
MSNEAMLSAATSSLPQELALAQAAINLPEVQEILKKLSEYNLGVFMPHMHEEVTGEFRVLPKDVVQLEDGLKVSFISEQAISDPDSYVPIGWVWRENGATSSAMCVMRCFKKDGDLMHYSRHEKE